jgi:hypothetical protein
VVDHKFGQTPWVEHVKAYLSVYRKPRVAAKFIQQTRRRVDETPHLAAFIDSFLQEASFLDWGDDPAFFAAQAILGDIRRASWGVCRRTLRAALQPGDLVIFFCTKQRAEQTGIWDYYFIGYGTIGSVLSRQDIWEREDCAPYRGFFNLLVRPQAGDFVQWEPFASWHKDWTKRMPNYLLFDRRPGMTEFGLSDALRVASYNGEPPERWIREPLPNRLFEITLGRCQNRRGLRTSTTGFAHPHVRLPIAASDVPTLREDMAQILASRREGAG